MIKKIPCGGFSYDDSEITFENGVIHPIGGGGGDIYTAIVIADGDKIIKGTCAEIKEHIANHTPFTILMGYLYAERWEYATYVSLSGSDVLFGSDSPDYVWAANNHIYYTD